MINRFLYLIGLLLSFVLISCANDIEQKKIVISELVDSIGKIVAPDKRLVVWNYEVSDTNGQLSLKLESDFKSGVEYLKNELSTKFPDLKMNISLLPHASMKEYTYGIINVSSGNIRKSPKHNSELVSQELMGTPVEVLKEQDDWYLIESPNGYIGWIDGPALSLRTMNEILELGKFNYIIFIKHYGQVYKTKKKEEIVSDIVLGNILKEISSLPDFYMVMLPDGRRGFVEKDGFVDIKSIGFKSEIDTNQMVSFSKKFMGISYLWGGKSSKAIDCSGFTAMIYFFQGIILQRDASQQFLYGEWINPGENFSNLKTGDLLFFCRKVNSNTPAKVTHEAMYIGNGEFIHASGMVRISSLIPGKPNYSSSYVEKFLGARRIVHSAGNEGIEKIQNNQFYQYFFK